MDTTRSSSQELHAIGSEGLLTNTKESNTPSSNSKHVSSEPEVQDMGTKSSIEVNSSLNVGEISKTELPTARTQMNIGTACGEFLPAQSGPLGVQNSATGSYPEAEMPKKPQHIANKADLPQPSTESNVVVVPQKEQQTPETEKNSGTASSASSPSMPDQLRTQDSTTCSKTNASSAPQRLLDNADPPRSSSTPGTDIIPQKKKPTEYEGALIKPTNTSTVTLAKAPDLLQNQRNDGDIKHPTQGSHFTSRDVKDGTVLSHPLGRDAHPDHNSPKTTDYETTDNSGQGVSTPLELEKQSEKKTKADQKVPGVETDQGVRKHREETERLLVDVQPVANTERKAEIEPLEEKYEKEIKRLEELVAGLDKKTSEAIECLQTKVSNMADNIDAAHKKEMAQLEEEYAKETEELEVIMGDQTSKEIQQLQAKASSIEHDANAKLKQVFERLEKQEKEIKRLEALVVDMSKQTPKKSQTKAPSEEDANQSKPRPASNLDPAKGPDNKLVNAGQPSQARHSNGLVQGTVAEKGLKTSPPSIDTPEKQTSISSQAVVPKPDSLSVTDVANMVKLLNAEIGQTVHLLTESLSEQELSASNNGPKIPLDELRDHLGSWLFDKLRQTSEIDPLITQLALQTGLVNVCSYVVNNSPFWCNGDRLHRIYSKMAETEGQAIANEWKAQTSKYLDWSQCEDANKTYLTAVMLKLVTAAVGGTLKSNESFLSQYNQQVEVIAKMAANLRKTIIEDVTSVKLVTYTVPCGAEFNASQMEDTESDRGHSSVPHGKVVCTQDMGLRRHKPKVEPNKSREPSKDERVTMKAKVVLDTTLET